MCLNVDMRQAHQRSPLEVVVECELIVPGNRVHRDQDPREGWSHFALAHVGPETVPVEATDIIEAQ